MNSIYKANQKILHGDSCSEADEKFLIKYWSLVANNMNEWHDVMNKSLTKKDLRENYIATLAITLNSLGRLGRTFYDDPNLKMESYLKKLKNVDWLRSNEDWKYRAIRENGKILNSDEATILMCSKIKTILGLELTKEEQQKENQLLEKNSHAVYR